ncbi:helix-turn-helix domain-containing protein [Floccifex sp.]|uniref:helix-turn-helix domain-containing protein n=1 Tax=Floccifex sp. TaxID=2815810 RepID=UPI00387E8D22
MIQQSTWFSNYSHEITISSLCDYFYCSKATLINTFKKRYNQTVHQYLLNYRLEKAKEQLKIQSLSISQIAYNCGFNDANYFSKAFKKKYGVSPSMIKNKKTSR